MELPFKLELGRKAKDAISGFTGIITGRHEYLYGCNRYTLSPTVDKDGKIPEAYCFDERQIILLDEPAVQGAVADTGGPPTREPRRGA